MFDKMLAQKDAMTPDTGANVVGLDDFEPPGEQLYLIKHCATVAEAEKVAAEHRKSRSDKVYVYVAAKPLR